MSEINWRAAIITTGQCAGALFRGQPAALWALPADYKLVGIAPPSLRPT